MTRTDPIRRVVLCGGSHVGRSSLLNQLSAEFSVSTADRFARPTSLHTGVGSQRDGAVVISFETSERRFEINDPQTETGHFINLIAASQNADAGILLVDAQHGIGLEAQHDSCVLDLLGIRTILVVVNKMDQIEWNEDRFKEIDASYRSYSGQLRFKDVVCVPISTRDQENVVKPSIKASWHSGGSLLDELESLSAVRAEATSSFRLPVQRSIISNSGQHEYFGVLTSGSLSVGDNVAGCINTAPAVVTALRVNETPVSTAYTRSAVTVQLDRDIGDGVDEVLAPPESPVDVSDQFAAKLLAVGKEPVLPHRQYRMRIGGQSTDAQIVELGYVVDVQTMAHNAADEIDSGEIAYVKISTDRTIAFDSYANDRDLGSFVLFDRMSNSPVAWGAVEFGLRRATNVRWQSFEISKDARAHQLSQKPCVIWFTGLPASGKTTVAGLVEERLFLRGRHSYILDGDNLRHGLTRDLGFTVADRVENIKRVAEVAKLFVDAGLITLVSLISPFRNERRMARELLDDSEFIEVFMNTPLDVCEQRDPKGLYAKARRGELQNFTGIDSAYERPENPELTLDSVGHSPSELAQQIVEYLTENQYI